MGSGHMPTRAASGLDPKYLDQVDQVDQIWTQWSSGPTQRTDPVGRPSAQLHIYHIYRLYICKLVDIYAKTNRKQIAQT